MENVYDIILSEKRKNIRHLHGMRPSPPTDIVWCVCLCEIYAAVRSSEFEWDAFLLYKSVLSSVQWGTGGTYLIGLLWN